MRGTTRRPALAVRSTSSVSAPMPNCFNDHRQEHPLRLGHLRAERRSPIRSLTASGCRTVTESRRLPRYPARRFAHAQAPRLGTLGEQRITFHLRATGLLKCYSRRVARRVHLRVCGEQVMHPHSSSAVRLPCILRCFRADGVPSLHFSPPDGRSARYDRHDFVALACRARRTVKYACARQAACALS